MVWATLAGCLLLTGCVTLKPERIVLNREKGIYEYQLNSRNAIPLRDKTQQLVDTANYIQFRQELADIKYRYPFKKRMENEVVLRQSDMQLARQYEQINRLMQQGDYRQSVAQLDSLPSLYPGIDKYSDVAYLKAVALERLGQADSARSSYEHFLKYSGQKFSARFRGYRDRDVKDRLYAAERKQATLYLEQGQNTAPVEFTPITPQYYYGSFQPGFGLNREDLNKNTPGLLMLYFGSDFNNDFASGLQYYYKINDRFSINPRFSTSGDVTEFSLAVPVQLYQSPDNRFGFKFTPYMNYLNIDSLVVGDQKYALGDHLLNFGVRLSAGYYLCPNVALGAYYQTNMYNKDNRFRSRNHLVELWLYDDYDASVYYNIYKGCSLKTGVRNDDLVVGFVWSFWEISYDITHPGMIFRIDMY